MLIEDKQNNKITVSFSATVGTKGIKNIKRYIEFLETNTPKKVMSKKEINLLGNSITKSAWLKMSKKKQS